MNAPSFPIPGGYSAQEFIEEIIAAREASLEHEEIIPMGKEGQNHMRTGRIWELEESPLAFLSLHFLSFFGRNGMSKSLSFIFD